MYVGQSEQNIREGTRYLIMKFHIIAMTLDLNNIHSVFGFIFTWLLLLNYDLLEVTSFSINKKNEFGTCIYFKSF